MPTVEESILRSASPRSFRLIEIVNSQPEDVRTLALRTLVRANGDFPVVIEMAKNNPFIFIRDVRENMERAAAASPRGESVGRPRGQATQGSIDNLRRPFPADNALPPARSRGQIVTDSIRLGEVRDPSNILSSNSLSLLQAEIESLLRPRVYNAITNQSFLPETKRWATPNTQSNEPSELDSRAESRPLSLMEFMELLRSESEEVSDLAYRTMNEAGFSLSPDSMWRRVRVNPQPFLAEMRRMAALNARFNEIQRGITNVSERTTTQPHVRASDTPVGIDPNVFRSLPDHIRAELLDLLPLAPEPSPQPPQVTPGSSGQSASQGTRPAAETTSASSLSQAPAEDRVEEVSFPRINQWLQSRTGPKPLCLCVWCQEEVVISDGDLQPENGEREPSYQLPCSHIVGQ